MAIALVAVTLLVVGGAYALVTKKDTTPVPRTLTSTQVALRANQICASGTAAAKAVRAPATTADKTGLATYLSAQSALSAGTVSKLRTLRPPAAQQAAYATALSAVDKRAADQRLLSAALRKNDVGGIRTLTTQLSTDTKAANAQLGALGLRTCVS